MRRTNIRSIICPGNALMLYSFQRVLCEGGSALKRAIAGVLGGILLICSLGMNTLAEEHKYQELIDYLEAGDYDSAIEYIQNLKVENGQSLPEDLTDYLLEVEITEDNFSDYFEIVNEPIKNAFGEDDPDQTRTFFASKMYDQGYYIYQMDDIPVEADIWNYEDANTWVTTIGQYHMTDTAQHSRENFKEGKVIRVGTGKVVYIKKEAVIIEEDEANAQDPSRHTAKLIIKHGDEVEELYHAYFEGHMY